jgi:hypothetical protein
MTDLDKAFAREVGRFLSREKRNRLLSALVAGGFFSLAAAVLYALVNDFLPLPLPSPVFSAVVLACGAAAAAALALFSPIDPAPLLIRADKALANGELASTAYGLGADADASIFRSAIVEDAVHSLSAADPARILGRPRMRLLPFLPIVLACAVFFSIVPIDFMALLAPKHALDPQVVGLGEELENFGRTLEKKAHEDDLERSLALAEELLQLGTDFQNQRIDQSEAAQRLAEVESRIAEEYGLRIQRFDDPSAGKPGKGTSRSDKQGEGAKDGEGDSDGEGDGNGDKDGERGNSKADRETKDLSDTLDMLSEKRKGLGSNSLGADTEDRNANPGNRGSGPSGDLAEGTGDNFGETDESGKGNSARPGTAPAPDTRGPATDIERTAQGEGMKADARIAEGDFRSFLLRALPNRNRAGIPETDLLGQYGRTAESALAGEEIPLGLREYVKNYFISLGMLGADK